MLLKKLWLSSAQGSDLSLSDLRLTEFQFNVKYQTVQFNLLGMPKESTVINVCSHNNTEKKLSYHSYSVDQSTNFSRCYKAASPVVYL